MKKVVMKVDLYDDKGKKKALKAVSSLSGIESVSVEMKDKKLTVVGDIDPVALVNKLIKICHTEIITVGPAKAPEKKDDKKDDAKKNEKQMQDVIAAYQTCNPYVMRQYVHYSADENPNSCVIL